MPTLACPQCGATDVRSIGVGQFRCSQCNTALGLCPPPSANAARCLKCQAVFLSDAVFCHVCGTQVQTLVTLRPCPVCGRLAPMVGSFCPYCCAQIVPSEEAGPVGERLLRHRETVGCPACGQTIGPTAEVCPSCGVNIEAFVANLRQQGPENLAAYDKRHGYDTRLLDNPPEHVTRRNQPGPPAQTSRAFFYISLFLVLLMLMGLVALILVLQTMSRGM